MKEGFHNRLKYLINEYVLLCYGLSQSFPKYERFGMTSQATRASLSVMLNYIEGYSRTKKKVMIHAYETAYGSLQESIYVYYLGLRLGYINQEQYSSLHSQKEEIAKMLWSTIQGLKKDIY